MTKRRTRRQKLQAKHEFQISWNDLNISQKQKTKLTEASVKRQKGLQKLAKSSSDVKFKSADNMVKEDTLRSIKIDLAKNLLISALIIVIEMVLYLTWV